MAEENNGEYEMEFEESSQRSSTQKIAVKEVDTDNNSKDKAVTNSNPKLETDNGITNAVSNEKNNRSIRMDAYHSLQATCYKEPKSINLSNFDPFNPKRRINSPRSLEVCLSNGIDPLSLYHKSYETIKRLAHPLKRNDNEYLRLKYIETENHRRELLNQLQDLRDQLILYEEELDVKKQSEPVTRATTTKFSTNFPKLQPTTCAISLVKNSLANTKVLDKELVKYEEKRAVATTAKELKSIITKLKGRCIGDRGSPQSSRKENSSFVDVQKKVNVTTLYNSKVKSKARENKHKMLMERIFRRKEEEINQRIKQEEYSVTKWKRTQEKLKRRQKLLSDIENDKTKERKRMIEVREEYKRERLLEQIKKEDERSEVFKKQKVGLHKLRQEIRKNANYNKYQAKLKLEKIVKKANTLASDEVQERLVSQMFEAAGLGKVWQLANGIENNNKTYTNDVNVYESLQRNGLKGTDPRSYYSSSH